MKERQRSCHHRMMLNCTSAQVRLGMQVIMIADATWNMYAGDIMEIPKAVCLHEEDAGILWKHMDYRTGHAEVRRSRRLVLSFISTVVNYEYAFYWYFYQVSLPFSLTLCLLPMAMPSTLLLHTGNLPFAIPFCWHPCCCRWPASALYLSIEVSAALEFVSGWGSVSPSCIAQVCS